MKTFANTWQQSELVSGVNIKTINNTSILWSGNIDVSWWGGWGGFEPTELWWNANIWELSEWAYLTEYNLYYTSWQAVPEPWSLYTKKQLLFVTEESSGGKWFFVFSVWHTSTRDSWYASYWYSMSSSVWACFQLGRREWTFNQYATAIGAGNARPEPIWADTLVQDLENIDNNDTNVLSVSSDTPPYPWVTYTIYVKSVSTGQTYTISLGTWVTNPLNIALPTNSNKICVITLLATSTTTAIVTWCTIAS